MPVHIKSRLNTVTVEENWAYIILTIGILRWRKRKKLPNREILEVAKLEEVELLLFFLDGDDTV